MDLGEAMDADAGADVAGQLLGSPAWPEAREKAMLKRRQQVGLQVIAAVTAHPGPALQTVKARISTVEGRVNGFGHLQG